MIGRRVLNFLASPKISSKARLGDVYAYKTIPSCVTLHCNYHHDETVSNRHSSILSTKTISPSTLLILKRYKSGKKKKKQTQVEESDDDDDEEELEGLEGDKHAKINTMQLNSMRIDLVVKTTLGIARNKAEVILYESKIRVNGERVTKKSVMVNAGDLIDVIRGPSPHNPDFIIVTRVTILSAVSHNDGFRIKFTRDKSLVIENYEDSWTPLETS